MSLKPDTTSPATTPAETGPEQKSRWARIKDSWNKADPSDRVASVGFGIAAVCLGVPVVAPALGFASLFTVGFASAVGAGMGCAFIAWWNLGSEDYSEEYGDMGYDFEVKDERAGAGVGSAIGAVVGLSLAFNGIDFIPKEPTTAKTSFNVAAEKTIVYAAPAPAEKDLLLTAHDFTKHSGVAPKTA